MRTESQPSERMRNLGVIVVEWQVGVYTAANTPRHVAQRNNAILPLAVRECLHMNQEDPA